MMMTCGNISAGNRAGYKLFILIILPFVENFHKLGHIHDNIVIRLTNIGHIGTFIVGPNITKIIWSKTKIPLFSFFTPLKFCRPATYARQVHCFELYLDILSALAAVSVVCQMFLTLLPRTPNWHVFDLWEHFSI